MSVGPDVAATSALIIEVPEAEALVGRWREIHDRSAAQGVPPHVTILFPFVPPAFVDDEVRADVRRLAASHVPFDATLARVEARGDVVWLSLEPEAPFRDLIAAATAAFPDHPPYGGRFDDVIPHLTVGQGEAPAMAALWATAERGLAGSLPIGFRVTTLSLFVSAAGRWSRTARFPLGTARREAGGSVV